MEWWSGCLSPACFPLLPYDIPSFLSVSHLSDPQHGSWSLGVWSEALSAFLPPPGALPCLIPLLPVCAVNMTFYSFGDVMMLLNLFSGMSGQ